MFGKAFFAPTYYGDTYFGPEAGTPAPVVVSVDGSGLVVVRKRRTKPVRPLDSYRTPEDIRREQLETERYLASLEKPQQVPAPERRRTEPKIHQAITPAAPPILADVAARAASAVLEKLEEAASAAALRAQQERRRTLALLLAID